VEFIDVVRQRRAVRDYRSDPVPAAEIDKLLALAVQAPSAMNLQPWSFAVITDRARIDDYARRAKEHLTAHPEALGLTQETLQMLRDPATSLFYQAPVLLLIMARSTAEQDSEDCCLAAQTLMLAARDAGLGTCWIGLARPWLNLPATKRELGLPAECRVVAPLVLGFPTAWPEPHGRKPADIRLRG
jgi:nitroreductase